MAWVERRITRTSQPQDAVGIDWTNPLTKGLKSLFVFINGGVYDLVAQKFVITAANLAKTATTKGIGLKPTTPVGFPLAGYFQTVDKFSRVFIATPQVSGTGAISDSNTVSLGAEIQIQPTNLALNRASTVNYVNFPLSGANPFCAAVVCDSSAKQQIFVNGKAGTARSGTTSFDATGSGVLYAGASQGEKFNGAMLLHADYGRLLTDAEAISVTQNGWQLLEPEIQRIWVDDFITGGAVTGNASGSLSAISLSPVIGTASGSASASASLSAISLSAINGTASGASIASGVFAPISLSAINATANGAASASTSIAPISLSAITGTANGSTVVAGNASGAFYDVALSPVSGTASGTASANGALSAISLTAINGTASGGAIVAGNASGAFDDVSLTALTGAASGGSAGVAAGVFASLSINPATGAAYGAAVAVGSLPVITLTPLTGSATGVSIIPAYASGAFDDITLSPLTGVAAVIRRIRPIVPNYNTMSVDASYNVAYIDPTYWID